MNKSFVIILFVILILSGCGVKKAYESLEVYNYFDAKNRFEKKIDKFPSQVSYGLATIYSRDDNPFSNLDSAFKYIEKSIANFSLVDAKELQKLKPYGFEKEYIFQKRQEISSAIFDTVKKVNTIEIYNGYISGHAFSIKVDSAKFLRDKIAYLSAKNINSSKAYENFLNQYTNSVFSEEIQQNLYARQYYEATENRLVQEYLGFLKMYPKHPYRKKAEDAVYQIYTENNRLEQIEFFIDNYPNNSNINDAWMKLYQLKTESYTEESIANFIEEYESFPFKEQIVEDLKLSTLELLPYKLGSKFGFISKRGEMKIAPTFESVSLFKEGLSVVGFQNKFGFINKKGEFVIDAIYDDATEFDNGRAIVSKNNLYGMVDKTGKVIIPVHFKDIGPISDGLFYAKKDSLYAYYDQFGFKRIEDRFNEAYTFENKEAQVIVNDKVGYIDVYGSYTMYPTFENLKPFWQNYFIIEKDGYYGIITKNYQEITPVKYDFIGSVKEGRALIITEDGVGYLNKKGEEVIPPILQYYENVEQFGNFKNGYAKVMAHDKFGIIDSLGNKLLPVVYNDLGTYSELIAISKGNGYGYTDESAKLRIPYLYEFAESFKNGVGIVQDLKLYGLIDNKNHVILPLQYTNITYLTDTLLLLNAGSKFGVASVSGEIMVPVEYQQIKKLDSDLLILSKSDTFNYFYIPERRFITLE